MRLCHNVGDYYLLLIFPCSICLIALIPPSCERLTALFVCSSEYDVSVAAELPRNGFTVERCFTPYFFPCVVKENLNRNLKEILWHLGCGTVCCFVMLYTIHVP